MFRRKRFLRLGFFRRTLLIPQVLPYNDSLAPPLEGCCLQAVYPPCPVLSESSPSGGDGRVIAAGGPPDSPRPPLSPKCNESWVTGFTPSYPLPKHAYSMCLCMCAYLSSMCVWVYMYTCMCVRVCVSVFLCVSVRVLLCVRVCVFHKVVRGRWGGGGKGKKKKEERRKQNGVFGRGQCQS